MKFIIEMEPQELGTAISELVKALTNKATEVIDVTKLETVDLSDEVASFGVEESPKAAKTPKHKGRPKKDSGPTIVEQITELLRVQPLASKHIKEKLTAMGRNPESIYPVLKSMRDDFIIETRDKGLERLNFLLTPEEAAVI